MLEVAALQAFYGDSQILHGLNLTVDEAERVAVVGRNGAGKSTLLKSIMNGGPRADGQLRWRGAALDALAGFERTRRGLSLVPEDRRIFPHLTVIENLKIAHQGARKDRRVFSPDEMIQRFPMLAPLTQRFGDQLSGGQQQLLAVARGFAPAPDLLLLDEPTEGLAPIIVEQMAQAIIAMCEAHRIGLLLSEQNLSFARACTSRVYVLDTGRIMFSGSWAELDAQPDIKTRHLAV